MSDGGATRAPAPVSALHEAALRIADAFVTDIDPVATVGAPVRSTVGDEPVDLVAVGKASRAMARAVVDAGVRIRRRLLVGAETDEPGPTDEPDVVVGDHPVVGARSLAAGDALVDFLRSGPEDGVTVFLVSGGGSSLCARPAPPVRLDDLTALWHCALASGLDIGELNTIRTATSAIAGGAVRRHVRSEWSASFVAVDNLVTGAPGTSSGLTYDTIGDVGRVSHLLARAGVGTDEARRFRAAVPAHNELLAGLAPPHENVVVADPTVVRDVTMKRARDEGFTVIDAGVLLGDAEDCASTFFDAFAAAPSGRVCVVGVGELTVRVDGGGRGGRCQHFALAASRLLATLPQASVLVARATDGRDHLPGVGGAWVDSTTCTRALREGVDIDAALARCDSHTALSSLQQLIDGRATGWNLCDVYVACAVS